MEVSTVVAFIVVFLHVLHVEYRLSKLRRMQKTDRVGIMMLFRACKEDIIKDLMAEGQGERNDEKRSKEN